jgi:hypothetical protein
VTVAENWFVAPVFRLNVDGLTATDVMLAGLGEPKEFTTVTLAVPALEGVCTLVAVTTSLPPVVGAV